ncbi:MAG: hypothetical protein MUQ26_05500 [Armatimonadetes bacterium]|nr:hypothetical protein [Armatimonadota bacterium]
MRRLACLATGVAALSLLAAAGWGAEARSSYFRVIVSPECTIYGMLQDRDLRFSATPEGLAMVSPIKAEKLNMSNRGDGGVWYSYTFPDVTLSVPEGELPDAFTKVKAALQYQVTKTTSMARSREAGAYVHGSLGLCREDEKGVEWSYWSSVGTETGSSPERAPAMRVPKVGELSLKVTTQAKEGRETGIAVEVMAGEAALTTVKKAGKSVTAELEVLDKDRKTVASEKKPLSDLGFT